MNTRASKLQPKTETVKNSTRTGSDWKNLSSTAHTYRRFFLALPTQTDTFALIYRMVHTCTWNKRYFSYIINKWYIFDIFRNIPIMNYKRLIYVRFKIKWKWSLPPKLHTSTPWLMYSVPRTSFTQLLITILVINKINCVSNVKFEKIINS
jgi:hypothetical protein